MYLNDFTYKAWLRVVRHFSNRYQWRKFADADALLV
jgi:hypothetical protein